MAASSIRPVTLDEIVGLERYESIRDAERRRIIELKCDRRVSVGPEVTFVFENHDTVWFQTQEMVRAERITDLDKIREELAVYNALLPAPGELSATMLIEITDQVEVERRLLGLLGIDEAVELRIGREPATPGEFEAGRSREDRLSAVQYVRFKLSAVARAAFLDASVPVVLAIRHPNYQAESSIVGATRESLARDLR